MKKRRKIYNNRPNLFVDGGGFFNSDWGRPTDQQIQSWADNWNKYDFNSPGTRVDQYKNSKNWMGISKQDNPFSKMNIKNTTGNLIGGLGSTIGGFAGNAIRGDFDDGGVGSGIQNVGGQIGDAISTVNPIVGGIVSVGSGLIGGLVSRMFGVKENKENTSFIKGNTTAAQDAGNLLASASSNEDLIANADKMVAGSNFDWNDLYENGWFTSKGTRLGNNLLAKENTALAMQGHGLSTGAGNVDTIQDTNVMRNFSALGGPLFGLGGNLDNWSNGVTHINTGGTHEQSPYDGIQLGVDQEGTPNLVEEDELVYGDYVFSNRLKVPEIKVKKGEELSYEDKVLKKYSGMTYADAAKKAERISGANERLNDETAKKGMEAELTILAQSQEKEREIQKLKEQEEAIKNMSPEEFAAMQQQMQEEAAAQQAQEEAAQQAAIQQQQEVPMEQQQQISPEEQAALEQQILQQQQMQPNMHAEGGELGNAEQQLPMQEQLEQTQEEQEEIPVEEMSTTQLNNSIEEIYNWAKQNNNRDLAKKARKARKASRDDKEDFVDDARDEIRQFEEERSLQEQQEQERQIQEQQAAQEAALQEQAAQQQAEQLAAQEMQQAQMQNQEQQLPMEEQQDNTFAWGGAKEQLRKYLNPDGKYWNSEYRDKDFKYLDIDPTLITILQAKGKYNLESINLEDLEKVEKEYQKQKTTSNVSKEPQPNSATQETNKNQATIRTIGESEKVVKEEKERQIAQQATVDKAKNETTEKAKRIDEKAQNQAQPSPAINTGSTTPTDKTKLAQVKKDPLTEASILTKPESFEKLTGIKSSGSGYTRTNKGNDDLFPKQPMLPFWSAIGLNNALLGYNIFRKSNYEYPDALLGYAERIGKPYYTGYRPTAQYVGYKSTVVPTGNLIALTNATNNLLANNVNPNQQAGILVNNQNALNTLGNLYLEAQKQNFANALQVAQHNTAAGTQDSQGALRASEFNSNADSTAKKAAAEVAKYAYAMKGDIDAAKANAISQGVTNLGNLLFNTANTKFNNDLTAWYMKNRMPGFAAKGGKLKRRRKPLI